MNTRDLEIIGGKEVSNLNFLMSLTIPFTAITSEALEIAKKEFLDLISKSVYKFTPKVLISYELEVLPLSAVKTELKNEDIDELLNCVAYTLSRSGKFKKPAYVFKKEGNECKLFSPTNVKNEVKNKMIYVLSPRIKYIIETGNVETAIINMIESVKKHKITKGKGFCFLKSHMLVEPENRRQLKYEVQTLFDYGIGNLNQEIFKERIRDFIFINVEIDINSNIN